MSRRPTVKWLYDPTDAEVICIFQLQHLVNTGHNSYLVARLLTLGCKSSLFQNKQLQSFALRVLDLNFLKQLSPDLKPILMNLGIYLFIFIVL